MNPNNQSVQSQEPVKPEWFDSPPRTVVDDLLYVAQGAALVLRGAQETLRTTGHWQVVAGGLIVALASAANLVDVYKYEGVGICLEADAVDPRARLYVLEKQAAELWEKIAEKQRGRS
jgi:hypothetical protein